MADKVKFVVVLSPIYSTNIFEGGLSRSAGTIAAKIRWSSLFDTSNVNQVLMSIYMTISNYSCQKYGTFSF
jgi:hypothetical protein